MRRLTHTSHDADATFVANVFLHATQLQAHKVNDTEATAAHVHSLEKREPMDQALKNIWFGQAAYRRVHVATPHLVPTKLAVVITEPGVGR